MYLQLCNLIKPRIYLAKSWVLEMAEPNFNFVLDFDKKITGGFIFLALQQALSKTLMEEDLVYLRAQFLLLEPNKSGRVTFENFRTALLKNATEAMKESRVFEILSSMDSLSFKKMDFPEFCAAAISVHQLEGTDRWEDHVRTAYAFFEKDGNHVVSIEELARV
jgi:Ca2+-binding EF-hand superfamily protein